MGELSRVLRQLPKLSNENVLAGYDSNSDAGVFRVAPDIALVQTIDFFAPLTDDPYVFGQIAAANSLSDVYAMGGQPVTALNVVAFPDDKLPLTMLDEILDGGAAKAAEAGAVVLGGHTIRDTEVKYGLAVTGLVNPDELITNSNAQVGDVLVLTKPIGTGATTAAYSRNKIDEGVWQKSCENMIRLNDVAAKAMIAAGAHAATDITGFGLLGHAGEVAESSGVTLEIEARAVPLLDGAVELSQAGFVTRAARTNLAYLESKLEVKNAPDKALYNLLIDAQTSGGLLIALAESSLDTFGKVIEAADTDTAWSRVGRIVEQGNALVRLL